jgi:hypothetical protein
MIGADRYIAGEVRDEEALDLILQQNPWPFDAAVRRYCQRFEVSWNVARNDVFAALWNLLYTYRPELGEFGARYYSTIWLRALDVGHNVFQWHREPGQRPGSRTWVSPKEVPIQPWCQKDDEQLVEAEISDLYDSLPELGPMKQTILEVMRSTGSFDQAITLTAKLHPEVPQEVIRAESAELKESLRQKIEREYPFLVPRKERRRHVRRDPDNRGDGEDDSDLSPALQALLHEEEDLLEVVREAFPEEG